MRKARIGSYETPREAAIYARVDLEMSKLFDLSKNVCPKCGTGHLDTPCGGICMCRCRRCDARIPHSAPSPTRTGGQP